MLVRTPIWIRNQLHDTTDPGSPVLSSVQPGNPKSARPSWMCITTQTCKLNLLRHTGSWKDGVLSSLPRKQMNFELEPWRSKQTVTGVFFYQTVSYQHEDFKMFRQTALSSECKKRLMCTFHIWCKNSRSTIFFKVPRICARFKLLCRALYLIKISYRWLKKHSL